MGVLTQVTLLFVF